MSLSVQFAVKGLDNLSRKIDKYIEKKRKQRKKALLTAAHLIAGDAKTSIQQGPKTGRVYGKHQASAPGQAPATDEGNLVRSITIDVISDEQVDVNCRAPYAAALELGTDDGKIKERPFMRPAAHKNRKAVSQLMREASRGN